MQVLALAKLGKINSEMLMLISHESDVWLAKSLFIPHNNDMAFGHSKSDKLFGFGL